MISTERRSLVQPEWTILYLWNDGVRVDDKNNLAHAERLGIMCPGLKAPPALFINLLNSQAQRLLFNILTTIIVRGSRRVRQRRLFSTLDLKPPNDRFHFEAERQTVVHVTRLLEPPTALETAFGTVVFRPCNPAKTVICVEPYALFAVGLG